MVRLSAAFEQFRRGLFDEAHRQALEIAADEPQNFWAYYLAAVSAAFAPNLPNFEQHLASLDEFETENVYLHYLKAYYALLQKDVEKALWHYLEIAEHEEGWLARSLLKKFRKAREISNIAFRVADFIVLPPELPPPVQIIPAKHSGAGEVKPDFPAKKGPPQRGWQFEPPATKPKTASRFSIPYRKIFLAASVVFVLTAVILIVRLNLQQKRTQPVPDLQIADSAAIMPVIAGENVLYKYKMRDQVISDFERAKQLLAIRKVNQSRYLLNRMIHSNADFQSREKARIFLGFIPDLEYSEFNDNLTLKDLFEHTKLRQGSLVIASGELRDTSEELGGTQYDLIAREGDEEYRVSAFKSAAIKEDKSSSGGSAKAKSVQIYGRFKGLVGQQRAIYLEALRVWR